MGIPSRVGPHLLVDDLARDAVGGLHRAVRLEDGAFGGHRLVRTFAEVWLKAGLGSRWDEVQRAIARLEGARVMPAGCALELAGTPHLAWNLVPGRNLAQVLARVREERSVLELDLALVVLQGVGLALARLHTAGLSHGLLTPQGVWVGFDGSIHLLDAPIAGPLRGLRPATERTPPSASPWAEDLAALGRILRETLTLEPADPAAPGAADLPPDLGAFLAQLEGSGEPLGTPEALERALEAVLFARGRRPAAFQLAFFMHTLFRADLERETLAQRAEAEGRLPLAGEAASVPKVRGGPPVTVRNLLLGAGVAAALLLVLGAWIIRRSRLDPLTQRRLAELSAVMAQLEQQRRDLEARSRAEADKAAQLQKQLADTRTPEARLRLQQQLAEAQRRKQEADEQQAQAEQRLAQERGAAPKPAPPAPAPEAAPPVAPAPTAPVIAQASPAPAREPVLQQARMVEQVTPSFPSLAQHMRWETDRDHLVRLRVYVGEDGAPIRVAVVEGVPGGYGFDESAVAAANQSRFEPALRDGRPARGWTADIVYRFQRRR